MTEPSAKGIFGDYFNNQKTEQFPSRFRKQDFQSPKFVQQQKLKLSGIGTKFQQLMDASLFHNYETPKSSNITLNRIESQNENLKMTKSQSVNKIKNKQFIVFPKIQKSIRDQQMTERNNLFLQYASVPHENLLHDKSISTELQQMISASIQSLSLNKKRQLRRYLVSHTFITKMKISPQSNQDHVCKKSVIIPYQEGGYSIPGLPNSQNRSKKLTNLSFTKMQWNITNYNTNFALSKKEKEIREYLKNVKIKKIPNEEQKDYQDTTQLMSQQGNKSTLHTEFNFFTTYSKSPKNEKINSPFLTSPQKQ